MNLIERLSDGLKQLIFPHNCTVCGRVLVRGEHQLCTYCETSLPKTGFEHFRGNPTEMRFWGKVDVYSGFSAYYYRKGQVISHLIHDFKYHNNREIAVYLGRLMGMMIKKSKMNDDYDCIVPVPLHPHKLNIRGYNQCSLLAQGVSQVCGLPVNEEILLREKFSVSQTKKSKFERITSLNGSFVISREAERFSGLRVLLLDDVLTTGATLEVCCRALSKIPRVRIGVVTLAFAND